MKLVFMDEALDDLEYIHDFLIEAGGVQVDEIKDRIVTSATCFWTSPKWV